MQLLPDSWSNRKEIWQKRKWNERPGVEGEERTLDQAKGGNSKWNTCSPLYPEQWADERGSDVACYIDHPRKQQAGNGFRCKADNLAAAAAENQAFVPASATTKPHLTEFIKLIYTIEVAFEFEKI